ncbi:MAG: hypothetical protein ABI588_01830 [Arenimonas sp.]
MTAALAQRVGETADVAQVADAIVGTWREIDIALTPIVGQRGISAMYRRSLQLTSSAHPWLAAAQADAHPTSMDLASLHAAFSEQDVVHAAAAAGALLQNFDDLLTGLIGGPLTTRLLRAVWDHSLTGPPSQDAIP